MTPLEILDLAGRIERKIADIYNLFRKEFSADEEASAFWEALVNEEETHAGFIDAEIRMLRLKPEIFGCARVDGGILKDTLKEMTAMEENLLEGGFDMGAALSMAIKIETELVEKRYNRLVEICDPQLKRIFNHLTKSDNHVEKVVKMAKRFGVKTAGST
ncbi:MAG: hypothetical protein IMF07_06370 [Proteobacteria bacterium]|nr:hypothetical protein [Pseudomonadota bacterium]